MGHQPLRRLQRNYFITHRFQWKDQTNGFSHDRKRKCNVFRCDASPLSPASLGKHAEQREHYENGKINNEKKTGK